MEMIITLLIIMENINNGPKFWQNTIKNHKKTRNQMIELNFKITDAMKSYLRTVGETENFTIRFEDLGEVRLRCNGDLFDLEQLGCFCEVFKLKLILAKRCVIENYSKDTTDIVTEYLFFTEASKTEHTGAFLN